MQTEAHGPEGTGHPASHDAHEEEHAHPPYMMIWGVLAVLMLAKVGVALLGVAQWMAITLLVLISLVSALLVALYYMHLRFEPKRLWILAFVPIPLIVIFLLFIMQDF